MPESAASELAVCRRWWGSFSVDTGAALRWQIGPLRMWLARTEREWRVIHEQGDDVFESTLAVAQPPGEENEPTIDAVKVRFGFRQTVETCHVLPALPDRALVMKPEEDFRLPPGEEICLFIGIPLWVGIDVGVPSTRLYEVPVFRPSDTWFGPPTEEGGCCYAARTRARLSLENVAKVPNRAVSVVRIRNNGESELALDRIRLPSPYLSLFASQDGQLWTEAVTLEREEDGQRATVDLARSPPAEIGHTELIAGPRERMEKGLLMRTFGGFL